ncbi:unnamed protein product [Lampetra planeri]
MTATPRARVSIEPPGTVEDLVSSGRVSRRADGGGGHKGFTAGGQGGDTTAPAGSVDEAKVAAAASCRAVSRHGVIGHSGRREAESSSQTPAQSSAGRRGGLDDETTGGKNPKPLFLALAKHAGYSGCVARESTNDARAQCA